MQIIVHRDVLVDERRLSTIWSLPETVETEPLLADIGNTFSVDAEPQLKSTKTWYDSFDWRLFRNDLYLFTDQQAWHLFRKDTDDEAASHPLHGTEDSLSFSWDFSPGRFRLLIEPILEMRSLQPLVTFDSTTTCLRILNKDDKIVARLFLAEHVVQERSDRYCSIQLQGVRGYDRPFKKLTGMFKQHGIVEQVNIHYPFEEGVQACGRKPLDYNSKFSICLQPELSARQAMIIVYRELLGVMLKNEPGILADQDSEFLHDFRVAVRRTRSGLGQVKNVLPADVAQQAKKDFAWLGAITGPTRDLDVYLLYEQNYRARLPKRLQKGLDSFFADIKVKREEEQRKLVEQLRSPQYREILSRWQEYLEDESGNEPTANSDRPVVELAREIIHRKYRKVMKDGNNILPSSPDNELHSLRIQCKKLRYTLEFFSSLFPKKSMKLVISHLKRLQNNLGDFNDLSVQQDMLRDYLGKIRPGSRRSQELSSSLGGLLTNLYHEQHRVREDFASRFKEFSASKNVKLYAQLSGKKNQGKTLKSTKDAG